MPIGYPLLSFFFFNLKEDQAPIREEVQSILIDTSVLRQSLDFEMYEVTEKEYYEVFLLSATYQKTGDACYEVYPISDACKKTRLHHNLIVGVFGIWLCGLRSHMLLIISLYKTRGRV